VTDMLTNKRLSHLVGPIFLWLAFWFHVSDSAAQELMDVRQFVRQAFAHTVPYETASRYDSTAVPTLLRMLADSTEEQHWPNIVITLGMIGHESAVNPLVDFLVGDVPRPVSHPNYIAKTTVLMALGYLVNKSGNEKALTYLEAGLDPDIWSRRGITWISPYHDTADELHVQLSTMAAFGLALSGHSSAADALGSYQAADTIRVTTAYRRQLTDAVAEALRAHRIVAREGLAAYYRRRQDP